MDVSAEPVRCPWLNLGKPDYLLYHDREWGVPLHDDLKQFEFLTLEGPQAGLSWYTVLRKRFGYRQAFAGFDPGKVARFKPTFGRAAAEEFGDHAQSTEDWGGDQQRSLLSASAEGVRWVRCVLHQVESA